LFLFVLQQLLHLKTKSLIAGSHSSISHRSLNQVYKTTNHHQQGSNPEVQGTALC
jgi:hypothetical protein